MTQNSKKKIVIFIPEFPVLTETFIQRDIVKLVQMGNLDIKVLCLKRSSDHLDESLKDLVTEVRLSLPVLLQSLTYLGTKKAELKKIRHILKGDLTGNPLNKWYLMFKSLGYATIIGKYHPDELHVHFYSDFSTIGMFVAIILGIPFSINAHARDVFEYPHLPKSKVNLAKFVTVCNKRAYQRCMEISDVPTGTGEDKIYLIHHGIDPELVFPSGVAATKYKIPVIFMGGTRITEKKGIEYMIEASKILNDRGIKHRVDLVGVGDDYDKLAELVEAKGLKDVFYLHGGGEGLPFSEVAKFYLGADIFALPIIKTEAGDSDGIPNVIIEAALAKLPVVTTDAGSVSELIINDQTGVVVPQKNQEALATEIEKLLFDDARKVRLAEAAYKKAREMFDPETNVRKLEKLLLS